MERRPSKRELEQGSCAVQKARKALKEKKRKQAEDDKLEEVIAKLKKERHLIEEVHSDLFGGEFDEADAKDDDEKDFPDYYNFLHKVPRHWLCSTVLGPLDARFGDEQLERFMAKKNKDFYLEVLEFACAVDRAQPFGPKVRAEWRSIYQERIKKIGLLRQLSILPDGEIEFESSGFYTLLPVFDPDGDVEPADHAYTEVAVGNHFKVSLGPFGGVINASWQIQKNHLAHEAFVANQAGKKPQLLKDFFEEVDGFIQFIEPLYKFVEVDPKVKKEEKKTADPVMLKRKQSVKKFTTFGEAEDVKVEVKDEPETKEEEITPPKTLPRRRLVGKAAAAK
mmetsp:Transcript_35178/g.64236  ORF Transcript_35178/g.64236 Transcript_35178/m.64236 type:complete len:337 (+) Transcript_35178:66-1076(+)